MKKRARGGRTHGIDDFSPHLLAVVKQPAPPLPRTVLYMLLLLFGTALVASFVGRLDVVVRAQGRLVPETRLKVVQPLEGGRVAEIHVAEGDEVKAGEVLLVMDAQVSEADTRALQQELALTRLQLRRVEAELESVPLVEAEDADPELVGQVSAQLQANEQAFQSALAELTAGHERAQRELAAAEALREQLEETLPISRKAERAYAALGDDGYTNRLAVLEKRRDRIETERSLQAQKHRIGALRAAVQELGSGIDRLRSERRKRLLDERITLQESRVRLEQAWSKQAYRNTLLQIRAPDDGVVKELAVHTLGSVVPSGTVLLSLVPVDEPLKAEVYVNNRDVGFVGTGQAAKVKLAAYDFQRYGMLDATVDQVSADAAEEVSASASPHATSSYRTLLDLDAQFLQQGSRRLELRPGMQVVAEIKIDSRSVMEYLLSPIRRGLSEAGQER